MSRSSCSTKPPSITTAPCSRCTEELEAIDWYDQRAQATTDESLAAILVHNRDDEKEHAAMALEWLRRRDASSTPSSASSSTRPAPVTEVGEGDSGAELRIRCRARSASAA